MADIVIIGDGVIGLSTALELVRQGVSCTVVGARHDGTASEAAAGLLSPHVGALPEVVRPFFLDSLARYRSFLEALSVLDPGLSMVEGLLEVPLFEPMPDDTPGRVGAEAVREIEPALSAPHGAALHSKDGAVDNVRLMRALRQAASRTTSITVVHDEAVTEITTRGGQVTATTRGGRRLQGAKAILAAGAWAPSINGLPRPLPIVPLKGQMLAFGATPLRRPAMSEDIYLVPRETETVAGATVEHAGFDTTTTDDAIEGLRGAAVALCPALGSAPVIRRWAGIRPATPDLLPIIGPDPETPSLLYACGHSRTGILLAPATAAAIAALALDRPAQVDISGFSINRFA